MSTQLSLAFTNFVSHPGTPSTPGASDFNRLQTNDTFFANRPAVMLRRDIEQNIPNGALTAIVFRVADSDADGMHPDANGVLSTVTCKMAGWYDIRAFVMWNAAIGGATPTGWRSLRILKRNPSQSSEITLWRDDKRPLAEANLGQGHALAAPLTLLQTGEHIRVAVAHTQGSSLNIGGGNEAGDATLSMIWVRQP